MMHIMRSSEKLIMDVADKKLLLMVLTSISDVDRDENYVIE